MTDMAKNNDFLPPFFAIPMPVDKDGNGPVTDGSEARIVWEVWDATNRTVSVHENKRRAVEAADKYNARDRASQLPEVGHP